MMKRGPMLKHVQTQRVAGREYRYLRVPGQKAIRLPDLAPDDPAFLRAYLAALGETEATSAPTSGTIAALVAAFLASDRFLALSKGYRTIIRHHGDKIRAKGANARATDLRPEHIRRDVSPLKPHPANARLKAWRLICNFGKESGLLAVDPSEGIKRKRPAKSDGHPPWTVEEIDTFRAYWKPETIQRQAFELLFWTGARVSDAVRLGRGMVGKDGVLSFSQEKTKEPAFVPWTCALPPFASAIDHAHVHAALSHAPAQMTYLCTGRGHSRSIKGLSNLISAAAKRAGITDRSAHGLRKSRAIALVDAGATTAQGTAWTGHLTSDEFEHYSKNRDRRAAVTGTEPAQPLYNPLYKTPVEG